jgi:phosphatidylglycerophosphate synthase
MTMQHLAVVDATRHGSTLPLDATVACLPALERSLRLAEITGCDHVRLAVDPDLAERARQLVEATDAELEIAIYRTTATSTADVLGELQKTIDDDFRGELETCTYLRSTNAYFRNLPGDCRERADEEGGIAIFEPDDEPIGDLWAADERGWAALSEVLDGEADTTAELVEAVRATDANVVTGLAPDRAWQMPMTDEATADRAGDQIWQDCRKPTDGPVSTHLNRRITLPISRQLGRLDISPNVVSFFAFFVGLAAGIAGTFGGYLGFLAAGTIYKINSLVDGFDGEMARGKYEFTDFGAWVDKFCDDSSDVFFVSGCGYGAYATGVAAPASLGAEFWLWIVGIYLFGKTLCSSAFYSIPFFEGELVHPYGFFDWWFEEEKDQKAKPGFWSKLFGGLKVLTKNDVFVAIAFLFAVGGVLPWFLVIFAVGQVGVGVSRIFQVRDQLERNRSEHSSPSTTASAGGE